MRPFLFSIIATSVIILLISINLTVYINLYGSNLIHSLFHDKDIQIKQIYFMFFTYIIISISVKIPYVDYSKIESKEEYDIAFINEMRNVTNHVFKMTFMTTILIATMFYI